MLVRGRASGQVHRCNSVATEDAGGHFGFRSTIVSFDNPASSAV
jgi:hypothetical protein